MTERQLAWAKSQYVQGDCTLPEFEEMCRLALQDELSIPQSISLTVFEGSEVLC